MYASSSSGYYKPSTGQFPTLLSSSPFDAKLPSTCFQKGNELAEYLSGHFPSFNLQNNIFLFSWIWRVLEYAENLACESPHFGALLIGIGRVGKARKDSGFYFV